MLLYNYGNTLIYLYLDLQSEYYQLSLHFIDPCLTTDSPVEEFGAGFSEEGPTQLSGFTAPPHLPLLSIPDSYTQENSPWRSSDSDSTYPTRSDGPLNPLSKVGQTFKKMEGKAWKSSATFSEISYTISRDNTSGEYARQAKLFAEFGKRRSCAFASSFAQHYDGAEK